MKTKLPVKVKNRILVNELFPEFTSDRDLELIGKWTGKKNKDGSRAESLVLLPNNQEIMIPDDFDIKALMDSAHDPVTGTLRNLKIDDRDLPQAKNFYDFSYRIIGRDANPPWSRQLWTGAMLFGEICPCCSDKKWLHVENVPKNFDSEFLTDKLTFLEHGVCPKCKRNKWDLIKNHGMKNYQQLVNVLGQRAGKSSSAATYCAYMTHQYLKFPDLASLAKNDMQASTELTGTFVSLNFAKALGVLWTPYKKLIEASSWFCIAEGTDISLADGTHKPIDKIIVGDYVKTFEGAQPVTKVFDNGIQECTEVVLENGNAVVGTSEHLVQCLGSNGVSLIWKKIGELTADDFVVVE